MPDEVPPAGRRWVLSMEHWIVPGVAIELQDRAIDLLARPDTKWAMQHEAPGTVPRLGVLWMSALPPTPHPVAVGPTECEDHADLTLDRFQDGLIVVALCPEGNFA